MVTPESIQGAMAESEQELTHELTAVRAQLQQVVSRLGSIEGKKIRFSLWQNLVCSLNLTFLCLGSQDPQHRRATQFRGQGRPDQQAQSPPLLNTSSYFRDMLMIVPVVTQVPNGNVTLGKEKGWGKGGFQHAP